MAGLYIGFPPRLLIRSCSPVIIFSPHVIRAIIDFYETPVGKKLAESNTKIAVEAMPIAQQIAQQTMQKFMEEAKANGYVK